MENVFDSGLRFRKIPRHYFSRCIRMDPLLDDNLEQWPHLNELVQSFGADWVKYEYKYGHYDSVGPVRFQNQIFEGPDTDMETELELANARRTKGQDTTDPEMASTSGSHFSVTNDDNTSDIEASKHCHFGESPLPAYEPVFDWENERSTIFGQRLPATNIFQYGRSLSQIPVERFIIPNPESSCVASVDEREEVSSIFLEVNTYCNLVEEWTIKLDVWLPWRLDCSPAAILSFRRRRSWSNFCAKSGFAAMIPFLGLTYFCFLQKLGIMNYQLQNA